MSSLRKRKIVYEDRVFHSELELEIYKVLRLYYKWEEILLQVPYLLTAYPANLVYVLDFETPHNYIEAKGGWVVCRQQEIQYLKTKSYWFINKYERKEFIIVTNSKYLQLPGIKVIMLNDLGRYLYEQVTCVQEQL